MMMAAKSGRKSKAGKIMQCEKGDPKIYGKLTERFFVPKGSRKEKKTTARFRTVVFFQRPEACAPAAAAGRIKRRRNRNRRLLHRERNLPS